ncbi:MAG: aminotransferase class V-fold PLP-dependent enzyme, partial [Chloroflexi bacterium]|nr:aminotransferase class V-fold PLP-dependent enzyme [Chloroflexota bacterium]
SLIGAEPDEIVFTSGGSESVNAAIRSALGSAPEKRVVVTSEVEHSAVRELLEVLAADGVETIHPKKSRTGRVPTARRSPRSRTRRATSSSSSSSSGAPKRESSRAGGGVSGGVRPAGQRQKTVLNPSGRPPSRP